MLISKMKTSLSFFIQIGLLWSLHGQVPGDLDPAFGMNGMLTTSIGDGIDFCDYITLLDNGQIIATGYTFSPGGVDFAMVKYHSDGSLDTSFGTGGKSVIDLGPNDFFFSLLELASGELMLCGRTDVNGTDDFALAKFDADGNLDASFGNNGFVLTDFENDVDIASDIVAFDGGLVLAGFSVSSSTGLNFAMAKYDLDGNLDTNFGIGGLVSSALGQRARRILVDSSDKLLLSGMIYNPDNSTWDFTIARYHSNGAPDLSFGDNGRLLIDFMDDTDLCSNMVLQADGKILLAGYAIIDGDFTHGLARVKPDGSLDSAFGVGGKLTIAYGAPYEDGLATALAIQPDGAILVGGEVSYSGITDCALARLNTDGSFDTSFGNGGKVITNFGDGQEAIRSIVVQPDAKILVGGYAAAGGTTDMALARYFSGLETSTVQIDGRGIFKVYPNPFDSFLSLDYSLEAPADISFSLRDIAGKHIKDWALLPHNSAGPYHRVLSLQDVGLLPSGIYLLEIVSDGRTASIPLLRSR